MKSSSGGGARQTQDGGRPAGFYGLEMEPAGHYCMWTIGGFIALYLEGRAHLAPLGRDLIGHFTGLIHNCWGFLVLKRRQSNVRTISVIPEDAS